MSEATFTIVKRMTKRQKAEAESLIANWNEDSQFDGYSEHRKLARFTEGTYAHYYVEVTLTPTDDSDPFYSGVEVYTDMLVRCGECGAINIMGEGDTFCEDCGAELL